MVKNRRANAVLFGFDFQRNAAIILMLERIKELRSVRLEGNEEDIELTLENGKKILAQAKAVEKSSSDFSHVRENLKKALISLSEGAQRVDAQELIFITNSPNPFNDEASRSVFGGLPTHRSFSSLPPSAQVTVQKYLGNIEHPLDSEKFTVQVFPFETDNEAERYKAVTQAMNDFIGIFSHENSKGKTTLLRFMLYSLGYNIPNTRKIKFDRCEVVSQILADSVGELILSRYSNDFIEATVSGEKRTYILPDQLYDLHKIIFGTENVDVLNNILGAFYADQEKGWTLLNRGTAIGSIRFNIEE